MPDEITFTVGEAAIPVKRFFEMMAAHPNIENVEDMIAAYPDVPAEDIREAWEGFEKLMKTLSALYEEMWPETKRALEVEEILTISEDVLEKVSFDEMLKHRERIEALEDGLKIMLSSAPKQEKRGPGRPTSPSRIAAYNFIRGERMSRKQAFDWWLEQEGIEPLDEDDYQTRFKSFKNAYRAWKSEQRRKSSGS